MEILLWIPYMPGKVFALCHIPMHDPNGYHPLKLKKHILSNSPQILLKTICTQNAVLLLCITSEIMRIKYFLFEYKFGWFWGYNHLILFTKNILFTCSQSRERLWSGSAHEHNIIPFGRPGTYAHVPWVQSEAPIEKQRAETGGQTKTYSKTNWNRRRNCFPSGPYVQIVDSQLHSSPAHTKKWRTKKVQWARLFCVQPAFFASTLAS